MPNACQGSNANPAESPEFRKMPPKQAVSILVIGLGIGWLTGLSVSPVISGVIASMLGLATGVMLGLKQASGNTRPRADAVPVALLVISIAVTSPLGILARTHAVFGQIPAHRTVAGPKDGPQFASPWQVSGLFAVHIEACEDMMQAARIGDDAVFKAMLVDSDLPGAAKFAAKIPDTETLKVIVEILCDPI